MKKLSRKHTVVAKFFLISSFLVLFTGCVTAKQKMLNDGYKPLTNQELDVLFSKSVTMRWTLQSMDQGNVEMSPDKTAKISHSGGIDDGTWETEDDRLCISWERFRGGGKECNTFFKIDENKFRVFRPSGHYFLATIE
ncbi:MAG: hypothetical protein ACR2PB_11455 [Desulfocapsaceae bacterium]